MARLLEARLRPGATSLFAVDGPEQLWAEHRAATVGRDLDIGGLSYALLDEIGPQQWPFPIGAAAGQPRLYEDHQFATPSGRARFIAKPYQAPLDTPDARHPLSLTTGRLRDQWHGMSRSGTVARLFGHDGAPALKLNPQELAERGLVEGDLARVSSRHGQMVLAVQADPGVAPAQAYVAMHWGEEFVSGRGGGGQPMLGVNAMTQPGFCPDSRQPELKFAAVGVKKLDLPCRLSAAVWCAPDDVAAMRARLRPLMSELDYAHCVPVAGPEGREGWSFEAACAELPTPDLLNRLSAALGLTGGGLLRYADTRQGRSRVLRLSEAGPNAQSTARLTSLLLVGEQGVGAWLLGLWRDALPVAPFGRHLLAPELVNAAALAPRSPQVCNCFDVSEIRIKTRLAELGGAPAERLCALQATLKCGTQCGSCLPTLRRLVEAAPQPLEKVTT